MHRHSVRKGALKQAYGKYQIDWYCVANESVVAYRNKAGTGGETKVAETGGTQVLYTIYAVYLNTHEKAIEKGIIPRTFTLRR